MKKFMDKDFLLTTKTSEKLYFNHAKRMPIIDYHCHIDPREIAEDKRFSNITELWLGNDHYKWRLMRAFGTEEKYITGDASDKEKFMAWAKVLGRSIGNPLYHWSHLELQRYFNYHGILNENTAEEVWNLTLDKLSEETMSARNIIKSSNVKVICTTDDPVDSLEWHKMIAADSSFDVSVLPALRPDLALDIEKPGFADYIAKLAGASKIAIRSFEDLKTALANRIDYFDLNGCRLSDHGLVSIKYEPCTDEEADTIFEKSLTGAALSASEVAKYKTACLIFLGREYKKRGWVMQFHYGCKRDNNTLMFESIGPNTGYDCIGENVSVAEVSNLLNALNNADALPKTILYSLNPNDNTPLDTVIGCFQNSDCRGKIQHGCAWWFNDNLDGMTSHLRSLASQGYLAGFIGMLTDSRSFVSYTRHEYFRRVLCKFIGELVESGEFPYDEDVLGRIIEDISYNNAAEYFDF